MFKRITITALLAILYFGGSAFPLITHAGGNGIVGDANCDAFVDVLDAQAILQFEAELFSGLPCPENADVTGGGAITVVDAALILQYDAGIIDELPALPALR